MIHFSAETYDQIIDEIKPMLPEHWLELAVHKDIPLDPDYDFYKRANDAGLLLILTVRDEGALIGYAIWVVKNHPHYKTHSWALNDIVWLRPDHRGFKTGRAFVMFWEAEFTSRGVHVVHVDTKTAVPMLYHLLISSGYAETARGVEKRLS